MVMAIAALCACVVLVAAQVEQQGDRAGREDAAPAAATPRFSYVDVFVDSGARPLAAYQVELVGHVDGGSVKIVGVEGGESAAFRDAPYYDPAAMQGERVVIGALSTLPAGDLPSGKVRIARVHVMVSGGGNSETTYELKLVTAAGVDAERIDAHATWSGNIGERK